MNLLKLLRRRLSAFRGANLIKSVYLNCKLFPVNKALHLPILLYGKVNIHDVSGKIICPDDLKFAEIKIGYGRFDQWPTSFLPTNITIKGVLIFDGPCIISGGVNLCIQSKTAKLRIGAHVTIGGGSIIKTLNSVSIGENSRVTGNCTIMDSNMHFVKNIDTGIVKRIDGPISIGNNCWINAGSVVTKGAVIPDYSIAARNTYLSKDYSTLGTNLFLVGSPAKATSAKVQRIFSKSEQDRLKKLFAEKQTEEITLPVGLFEEPGDNECF